MIIASLAIGADPSPEMTKVIISIIDREKHTWPYDLQRSIETAASRHDPHLQALIVNALTDGDGPN